MRWVMFALFAVLAAVSAFFATTGLVGVVGMARSEHKTAPAYAPESSLIFAEGVVEGAHPPVTLRFEVSGRIQTVHVKEGDLVKAGDVLAELEPELAALRLAEARARLRIAMAEREAMLAEASKAAREGALSNLPWAEQQARDAEAAFERTQEEGYPQSASRKPLDQIRLKRDRAAAQLQRLREEVESTNSQLDPEQETIAEAKITMAEAAVKRERILLEKCRLRSPIEGVVLQATPQPGEMTGPADERAWFTVADGAATRVRAYVEEFDAPRVSPGKRALVTTTAARTLRHRGKVLSCAPALLPKNHFQLKPGERIDLRVREVLIELGQGADLLVGMPVEVVIEP
jgi:multidrug resistance efflux pump